MFPRNKTPVQDCLNLHFPSTGVQAIPNCTVWARVPEGPLVENKLNSCGHRAGVECGAQSPDAYKIVLIGGSMAFGYGVARENTFAAELPVQLSHLTGRKVELYNEGQLWGFGSVLNFHMRDVLAAHPSMILWVFTPVDITADLPTLTDSDRAMRKSDGNDAVPVQAHTSSRSNGWDVIKSAFAGRSVSEALRKLFDDTRSMLLLRHLMYQSQSLYVKASVSGGANEFLRADQNPQWQTRFQHIDALAADIEGQARAAGVPVAAVLLPNRAQATLISRGDWPADIDPYKVDDQLRSIMTSHGVAYIDIMRDFRAIPNPEKDYFAVDGHPNADGHAVISKLLAKELTNGEVPALNPASSPLAASMVGK
ncbi:SGNH/GDSL hydrolase family protein [Tunturiibacter lichenicola]|uniref:SGNH/GDSL hydrolase family protein n=1 Tax=Tunturiibacter lichenicola TaxID=2051959 RepID=UPI003D9BE399